MPVERRFGQQLPPRPAARTLVAPPGGAAGPGTSAAGNSAAAGPRQIRVVVADRSLLLRSVLRRAAAGHDVRVVAETSSAAELVELCRRLRPQVTVSDLELDDARLEPHLPAILATGCRVLALCDVRAPDRLVAVLAGGASGYLLHDASPRQVVEGVIAVADGAAAIDPVVADTILQQWRSLRSRAGGIPAARRPLLTPREQDVLRAMVDGLPAKAIARRLGVTAKTVENHKIRIFDKLGVRTQAQAVSLVIGQGLLTPARGVGEAQ
jgi:DNA-binding NarL/FixJ family response regulator